MKKIGVVVDSTMGLPDEFIEKLGILIVRPNIIVDGKSYTDGIDITAEEVNDFAEAGKKVTSSQPSPIEFLEQYRELQKQGYKEVIVLTVSSGVSGTYQSAVLAADMIDAVEVGVVDSKTSAMGGELIIAEVMNLILEGGSLNDVKERMLETVERLETRITVDDLTALYRGGRMSRTASLVGSLLKIKPVIGVSNEGKLELVDKVRTHSKLMKHLVETIVKSKPLSEKLHVRIAPLGAFDVANQLKDMILEKVEDARVYITKEICPVLSVHFGRGGIGVSWLT